MSELLNSLLKSKGFVTLESQEVAVDPEQVPADQIDVDAVHAEIVTEVQTVEVTDTATEETEVEATATLESLVMVMESALPAGGLTAREAQLAQMSFATAVKQLKLAPVAHLSTEHFGGITTRYQSTQVSLESVKEKLSQAYAKVIEWLKKLVTKMKDIWIKVKQFCRGCVVRIDAAMKKVEALDAEKSLVGSFTDKSLGLYIKYLGQKGEKSFVHLKASTGALKAVSEKVYNEYMPKMVEALGKFDAAPDLDGDSEEAMLKHLANVSNLPGHARFTLVGEEDENTGNALKFVVEVTADAKDPVGTMLSKSEMKAILEDCKAVLTAINGHEKNWLGIENAVKKFETEWSKVEGPAGGHNTAEVQARARAIGRDTITLGKDFSVYAINVTSYAVKYVNLVLANWGGKRAQT
jgi:hypothetical protein